jgi:DNA replication protein DnaC
MSRSTLIYEIGYLPIDKQGADLLFQIVSERYERDSMLVTTNRPFAKMA